MVNTSVSVCIVSYNNKDDINKCLDSLYKVVDTSRINLDIFVSDNNSPDGSGKYLANKYPRITVIQNNKNAGYGYGHNKVLNNLNTKYHVVLNPDIVLEVDTINTLANYLNNNDDVAIVTPEIRNLDGTIQHLPKMYPKLKYVISSTLPFFAKYRIPYTMSDVKIMTPTNIQVCTGSFMMIRTDLIKKINGFDERFFMYFEDYDLSLRIREFGKIMYNPNTYVYHAWNRDSKKSAKMFLVQLRSMIRFYAKWGFEKHD